MNRNRDGVLDNKSRRINRTLLIASMVAQWVVYTPAFLIYIITAGANEDLLLVAVVFGGIFGLPIVLPFYLDCYRNARIRGWRKLPWFYAIGYLMPIGSTVYFGVFRRSTDAGIDTASTRLAAD